MKKILCFIALFICVTSHAQEFRKYANNFLYNGVDARGRSMGNAIMASSEDVFASYWNPAGLVDMDTERTQLGYMHVFDGLYNFDVAGLAIPTKKEGQVLGFTALRYGVDDIPNTIFLVDESGNINYDNVQTFSSADYGGYLTYSRRLNPKLSIGGSAKIIHRNVGDFASAWGGGIDFGMKYTSENGKFKGGAFARDLFGTYTTWNFTFDDPEIRQVFIDTGNEIPEDGSIEASSPSLVLGGNYLFDLGRVTVLPEANLDMTFDGERNTLISSSVLSVDPHAGIEVGYDKTIFLRAGLNNIQELTNIETELVAWDMQFSGGAGVKLPGFELDYALTKFDFREDLTHLVTLKLGLQKQNKQNR